MKKFILVSALLALMLLAVMYGGASAHSLKPNITCGSGSCVSTETWTGQVHGALTTLFVPSYTGSSSNHLLREISLSPQGSSGDFAIVGYCFGAITGSAVCSKNSGNYFWEVLDHSGGTVLASNDTYAIQSSDKGHTVEIGVSYHVSNGGGPFLWIHKTNSGTEPCNPCEVDNTPNAETFASTTLDDEVIDTWTGTLQGAWHWTLNQYQSTTDSNFYYFVNGGGGPVANNPPQMFWGTVPASGNNGGSLTSCDKDSGSTC